MQTEFEFMLPKGYLDAQSSLHRKGVMRLSTAMDEIVPLQDPRVKNNPAYATVIILSRVIVQLGAVEDVSPRVVEGFFACDLSYLQTFYRQINELEPPVTIKTETTKTNKTHPAALQEPTDEISKDEPVSLAQMESAGEESPYNLAERESPALM